MNNKEVILFAINEAKKTLSGRSFRMTELKESVANKGYRGNNNFWQVFKEKMLSKESFSTYRFKNGDPFNLQQYYAVKEEEHLRYPQNQVKRKKATPCEECSEEAAISFLKERGYRIFKLITQEVEV